MDDATDPPVSSALDDVMDVSPASKNALSPHRVAANHTPDDDPSRRRPKSDHPALNHQLRPADIVAADDRALNDKENDAQLHHSASILNAPKSPPVDPVRDSQFTYVLRSYNATQDQRVYSPYHHFGGFRWRLLIFPRGNLSSNHDLSVYLECGGPSQRSTHSNGPNGTDSIVSSISSYAWSRPAKFWLVLLHPSSPSAAAALSSPQGVYAPQSAAADQTAAQRQTAADDSATNAVQARLEIIKEAAHNFKETASDWGFLEFAPFSKLQPGKYADDHMNVFIQVRIHLQDSAPDPILSATTPLDSRKETGFVGFKNQGATCYMNSLLQTLYMVSAFRKAVYNMPLPEPGNENSGSELSYALQKVFYELQTSPTVVKTKKLTESFGWDTTDAFTQHDVQELKLILCDELAERMKKIAPDKPNTLSTLFQGKLLNYVECVNVDYSSTTEEEFSDLSLNVKGCRNIYESFEKYMEVEMMEGDNKYRADGFDELQEARKGVKFLKLPPVLQLHLKRFEYDLTRYTMVKINDRYEFGSEIDLSRFVENSDGTDVYVLHSVLVHIGDVNGGHYHAFIRPAIDVSDNETKKPGQWYKFDDETVQAATEEQAVQDNFGMGGERDLAKRRPGIDDDLTGVNGGQNPPHVFPQTRRSNYQTRRCSNAYMLQYLRKSEVPYLLKPPQPSDVPKALAAKIEKEREEDAKRQQEKAEQHLYMNIAVARDQDMEEHNGSDLVNWDKVLTMRVRRTVQLGDLKQRLQKEGVAQDARRIRLWRCVSGENDTNRPDSLVADGYENREITEPNPRDNFIHPGYNYSLYSVRHGYYAQDEVVHMYAEDLCSSFCLSPGQAYSAYMRNLQELSDEMKAGSLSPMAISDGKNPSIMDTEVLRSKIPVPTFPLAYGKEVLLFLKFYTPRPAPRLQWLGHFVEDRSLLVRELYPLFRRALMQYHSKDRSLPLVEEHLDLIAYEEESAHRVVELSPDKSLLQQSIPYETNNGSIIVFQQALPMEDGEVQGFKWDERQNQSLGDGTDLPLGGRPLPLATSYFEYLAQRIKIEFKDKATVGTADEVKSIFFELLRRDTYQTARRVLAGTLGDGTDADYLRFFEHNRDSPANEPLSLADDEPLDRILPMHTLLTPGQTDHRILWYERTEYHISQFHENDEVCVTWRPDGGARLIVSSIGSNSPSAGSTSMDTGSTNITSGDGSMKSERFDEEGNPVASEGVEIDKSMATSVRALQTYMEGAKTFSVLVPPSSKYSEVAGEVRRKLNVPPSVQIRMFEIKSCRILKIISPHEVIPPIMTAHDCGAELRAEPVPADETDEGLGSEYELMTVLHLAKDKQPRVWRGLSFFGNPFVIKVKKSGEPVRNIRRRIQQKLGVSSAEFDDWPLCECVQATVVYLDDEDQVYKRQVRQTNEFCTLAIEHKSSAPTRRTTLSRYADKPLKIRS